MPVMLERWNDDMMDALEAKVDGVGDQMREQRQETRELRRELRQEMDGLRQEMSDVRQDSLGLRQEMKAGFEQMHQMLLKTAIAMTSGVLAGFAALIVLIATLH